MEGFQKLSKVGLAIVAVITGILGYQLLSLKFDYDFEAFFPENDPETIFFEEHRQRFETDNDFIFIALKNSPSVFDQDFLQRVSLFVDSLSKDSNVREVQSITHLEDFVKTPFSPMVISRPYIHLDDPTKFEKDSALIFSRQELKGFFVNDKADALLIYIKHDQHLAKKKCDALKLRIDKLLSHYDFKDFKYAGRTIGLGYYVDKMQYETALFIGLSFILVIIFLAFTYRSFWGIFVPLTIVTLSMIWVLGIMTALGQPLNLILTVLPSILFVVSMSDVIHLVSKYMDEIRLGNSKLVAVKIAFKEVGLATFMTSLTTAIGFIGLLTINMQPVKAFGLYTAFGVMLTFALTYAVLPGLLILTKAPKISTKPLVETIWYKVLHSLLKYLIRNRMKTAFISLVICVISFIGMWMVKSDYFLLEDLSERSSLRKDYEYFDKEFMGLRPFELAIEVKDPNRSVLDYEVIQEIDKVENYLIREYGLKRCISIAGILKIANRTEHGGQASYYELPDENDTKKFIDQLKKFDKKNQLSIIVDSTEKYSRISSTIGDIGMIAINEKNDSLRKFLSENINHDLVEFKITGTAHLLDINMGNLSKSLMLGLLISVGIIALIMGFLYQSVKMVIIALIVNLIPLVMLSAVLGFSGVHLKVSTAIIFTIAFGIAVDDTLHFMSKFRLELRKGKSYFYALKRTFLSTGKAIVLTSVILCGGFLLLLFSDFLGTFYVGLLLSLTLLFALLADLILLPVLLMLFYKKTKS